jgi:hypothetical protein
MKSKKIAVLIHERDDFPASRGFFIWALCDLWRQEGFEIEVIKGPQRPVAADLLIPHIDLTTVPDDYAALFAQFPSVINRPLLDISKRGISTNLLAAGDVYDGPVIVKTNLNFGGIPEVNLGERPPDPPPRKNPRWQFWRPRRPGPDWGKVRGLKPSEYRVFPSLKKVPPGVFTNPALVAEKFLPEIENGLYHLRIHQFFGSCGYCVRLGSHEPIVKTSTVVTREEVPVPDEVLALRRQMGFDYGKIDFVMQNGRAVVFDINRTPGVIHPESRMLESAKKLAPGIRDFLPA